MSYKNYYWETMANDNNSPFIRNYIWGKAFLQYPKFFNLPRVVTTTFNRGNELFYIADMDSWRSCHEGLKKKVEEDYNFVEKIIDKSLYLGKELSDWIKNIVEKKDLKKLSVAQIMAIYREFCERQATLYALGVSLVILDFQGFSFIESNLDKFLKTRIPENKYAEYFKIFTQPIRNSFGQDQDEDLLKLMKKFYKNQTWLADIKTRSLIELKELYPKFYRLLQKHTQKYCWVYYVYAGPAYTERDFLGFIRDYLHKEINPIEKLSTIKSERKKLLIARKKYLAELKPDKLNLVILKLAGKMIWGKPRRKDFQSRAYYYLEKLQREIGRHLYFSLDQVRTCTPDMLEEGLNGGKISLDKIKNIKEWHGCMPEDDDSINIITGEEAKNFYEKYLKPKGEMTAGVTDKLFGSCAFAGQVTGKVKIINKPEEMEKMEYGDVLVSVATTPAIVPAMKKAAAIITDEGGLTCHASIVSRELQIPCVVGLKIATKVLKDGDEVEVDATSGTVRVISNTDVKSQ